MMPISLSSLLDSLHLEIGIQLQGAVDTSPVTSVTSDSRQVVPGSLFVAVTGGVADGHRYIPSAVEAGAIAVVGTRDVSDLEVPEAVGSRIPYAQVTDARRALAHLSAAFFENPSRHLITIGITGTDGKTTTATLLESILSCGQENVGIISTLGARIGGKEQPTGLHVTTPDAPDVQRFLAEMKHAGCRYSILESTSHGLAQNRVGAVEFDVAAITNITHEHLDYHGSFEAYREAKALLFRSLFWTAEKPGVQKTALINLDDPNSSTYLVDLIQNRRGTGDDRSIRLVRYSLHDPTAELFAHAVEHRPDRTSFRLKWWAGELDIETRLIGDFNISNILAAAGAALAVGAKPEWVRRGIAGLPGVLGRMERIDEGQSFVAIVDFAHSPASLERALTTLRPLVRPGGRLIAVFGSAGLRDKEKRRLMGQVSGRLADLTIVTAEDPRTEDLDEINREIVEGLHEHTAPERWVVEPDRARAISLGASLAHTGDVLASFGKGHERSMCIGTVEHPWNEQDVMRAALARVNESNR